MHFVKLFSGPFSLLICQPLPKPSAIESRCRTGFRWKVELKILPVFALRIKPDRHAGLPDHSLERASHNSAGEV